MTIQAVLPTVSGHEAGLQSPPVPCHPAPSQRIPAPSWRIWPGEQLWLWPGPARPGMRRRMRAALAEALAALPTAAIARIAALAEDREPAAALRLTARLLHACESGWQQRGDLRATALWLAVVEYRDERAALEFAHMALRRADLARAPYGTTGYYPPPLDQARRRGARMRFQALRVLAIAGPQSSCGRLIRDLGQLAAGDPLADLDAAGQPRRGWHL
jgi:hypothetical protein